MSLDIAWTITVQVPQLDTLEATIRTIGEQIVADVQSIKDEIARLNEGQAQAADAIAAQLNAILQEMQQFTAGEITQEQLDKLEASLKLAADTAEGQAASIRANTEQLTQIVPDPPPAP